MIRQSARTGRTFSTSVIQREVIQAQGQSGSNQNCTSSRGCVCAVTLAATPARTRVFRPAGAIPRSLDCDLRHRMASWHMPISRPSTAPALARRPSCSYSLVTQVRRPWIEAAVRMDSSRSTYMSS